MKNLLTIQLILTSSAVAITGSLATVANAQNSTAQLEEVVVTAQRREENLQKASVSIAAISGEMLTERGVSSAQGLNNLVPGLKITNQSGQVHTFIRGVGDSSPNAYTQASVSLNIDGVYAARSSAFGPTMFDIARIEVLRGPQGTLYGRNASGGAINIITRGPDLEGGVSGYVTGEVGNYELRRVQGAVNLPLSETFGLRGAFQITDRDGYLTDGTSDDKSGGTRLRALWLPTPDVTVNLIGEYAKVRGKGPGRVYRPTLFSDPWTGVNDPRITPALFPALLTRSYNNSLDVEYYGLTAQVDWDLGPATLTVLPSYRSIDVDSLIGYDLYLGERDRSRATSLEARLAGNTGQVRWVLGGYAYREDLGVSIDGHSIVILTGSGNTTTHSVPKFDTTAYAVFGEATFSLTDKLRLIGGLRYTEEEIAREGQAITDTYTLGVRTARSVLNLNNSLRSTATTWRAGVEYDLGESSMLFFTASKGFKSGGFDAADVGSFTPEYVTAYTLGSKNRFFDNRLQLNAEVFYWKYRDQQVSFLGFASTGALTLLSRNAGQSNISGISLDVALRPTQADTLTLGVEYLRTRYDQFRYRAFAFPVPPVGLLADGCTNAGPTGRTNEYFQDCSGKRLARAPEWSANARYTHVFDLGSDSNVTVGAEAKYESTTYLAFNYVSPNFRQDPYALFDLDVTYNAPNRLWSAQAYVRNIGDEAVYQAAATQSSIAPTTGVARGSLSGIGQPRTFGLRVQYNF